MTSNERSPHATSGDARRSTLPLDRKLPLLMTGVLGVALALMLALTYATLAGAARTAANERIHRVVRQLADIAGIGVERVKATARSVAADPGVVRALREASGPGDPTGPVLDDARKALRRFLPATDSLLPVELWTADGRRVAFVGRDIRSGAEPHATESVNLAVPAPGLEGLSTSTDAELGELYAAGRQVLFWVGAPVIANGERLGYVVSQRQIVSNPQAERTLREMSSERLSTYYRDASRPFWATLGGEAVPPPSRLDSSARGVVVRRASSGALLTAEHAIPGTPLLFVVEAPVEAVLAPARRSLAQLAAIGVAILLAGAVGSVLLGRRIAQPLVALTGAAESIAAGDFGARVSTDRGDEIGRLAASFNRMATQIGVSQHELELRTEQAQSANRAKTDFLATMSHELRTPLNAIAGYVDLLDLGIRGPVTDAQKRDLQRIRASQEHLLGLISGILDLSRIESGTVVYDLQPVALDKFLSSLEALIVPQARGKSLVLDLVPSPRELVAVADRERLRQVLLNLVSNAVRYTPAGGRVRIEAAPTANATVEISVSDTGPGIPHDRLEAIFEPFVQLDRSLTNTKEGIGLGLAISRDLARGMRGELRVESVVGQGSRFTLRLPRAPLGATPSISVSGESSAAPRRRTPTGS